MFHCSHLVQIVRHPQSMVSRQPRVADWPVEVLVRIAGVAVDNQPPNTDHTIRVASVEAIARLVASNGIYRSFVRCHRPQVAKACRRAKAILAQHAKHLA